MNYCGDCEYLDRNNEYKDWWTGDVKYKCKICGEYKKYNASICNSYKEIRKNTGSYTPGGCYITTIVCDVLGFNDDCVLLETLRNFRENYLKKHPEYLNILLQYDIVGPNISESIINCEENYEICINLYNFYLLPCLDAIELNNYEEAINIYIKMVNFLMERFEIENVTITGQEEYNIETLGKGRVRTKKASD